MNRHVVPAAIFLMAIAGCARDGGDRTVTVEELRENCPAAAGDVAVEVSDVETGVALTFTTMGGDLDDLHRRVEFLAQMYESHDGETDVAWHLVGEGMEGSALLGGESGIQPGQSSYADTQGLGQTDPAAGTASPGLSQGTGTSPGADTSALGTDPGPGYAAPGATGSVDTLGMPGASGTAGTPGTAYGQGMGLTEAPGRMPEVEAEVENLPQGARIVLTPEDPADLETLRLHARTHQQRMSAGECWAPVATAAAS
jgi:hypothetical protein